MDNINYKKCDEWIKRKYSLKSYFASLEPQHSIASSLGIPLKYSGYFALIPANLNLKDHLINNPITNYMFVMDNTNHIRSVTRSGYLTSSSLIFDKDRLIYIIGLISSIPAKNKDSITDDGFVSINSTFLRNFFKDYLSYLDYLILTGILCTDGQYIQGEKSIGYKFTEIYATNSFVRYNYPTFQQITGVDPIQQEVYNEENKAFVQNPIFNYPYLSTWYSTKKLSINEQYATRYANSVKQHKCNSGRNFWDINRDKSRRGKIVRKNPLSQYHAAIYNINSITIGDYKVSIDGNVHRLHSVITNLQKEYRKFLNYDNEKLVNVDISNSQPYLLCLLLNPSFWDKKSSIPLNIGMLDQNVQNKYSGRYLNEIRNYVLSLTQNDNDGTLRNYKHTTSIGKIYEYIADKINREQNTNFQRNDIKVLVLTTLFSRNRYMPTYKKYFKSIFPQVYELIKLTKREDHAALACLLQNVESNIILHRCCHRIWDDGGNKIPVFTIHDSICTTLGNEQFVKQIMKKELFSSICISPCLKTEYLF